MNCFRNIINLLWMREARAHRVWNVMGMNMKKNITIFILIVMMVSGGCNSVKGLAASENPVINTREELYQEVQKVLKEGKKEYTFETEDLQQEDLDQLNLEHDGFFGNVEKYQIKTIRFLNRSYITLYCNISDNYYVEDSILNGTVLSKEQEKAAELKKECEIIIDEIEKNSSSEYQKEKKIHDYIVNNVKYGYPDDNENEDSDAYNAYGALVEGKAVCNGYAQAMKLLCDLAGLECQMVTGTADGENHAWNLIRLDDEWYHTDVTWDDPEPDDPSRMIYSYFNLNDSSMESSHIWNKERYPESVGTRYNYYIYQDLYCADFEEFKEICKAILASDASNPIQIMVGDYDETIYTEDKMQFLFQYTGADSIHLQTIGKGKNTTLYITLQYD